MSDGELSSQPLPRFVALRYRDFRLLWLGEMVSTTGSQMQLFAINWHVFQLLRGQSFTFELLGRSIEMGSEAFGLGMLGLVRVIPIVLFALLGGMLADALDRRQLMIWTRVLSVVVAAVLTWLTLAGQIDVNSIYLLTALGSAATALDSPARQSIVANLVAPRHLSNAISLNTLIFQIATIFGPALAGLLVAHFEIGLVYGLNTLTFLVAIVAIALIRHRSQIQYGARIGWRALIDGIRFTFRTRIIMGTMLLDFFATLFASARTMLPIVAGDILGVGAVGYGFPGHRPADRRFPGRPDHVPARRNESPGPHPSAERRRLRRGHGRFRPLDQLRALLCVVRLDRRRRHRLHGDSRHHPATDDAR